MNSIIKEKLNVTKKEKNEIKNKIREINSKLNVFDIAKTNEEIDLFIRNEQMTLEKAMEKSGREDIWFSDIETAIIRTIEWLKGEKLAKVEEGMIVRESGSVIFFRAEQL